MKSVNSCIQFLPTLDGKALFTVEDLKQDHDALHPVQQAMVECHGSQCGFCTPGFVMTVTALLKKNPHPTANEVRTACSGNLCRCGTQARMLTATLKAAGVNAAARTEVIRDA